MNLIDDIGGAFLFCKNPKRLAEWYRDNLGISYEESQRKHLPEDVDAALELISPARRDFPAQSSGISGLC